ncbi:MAG: hypothetical protein WBA76_08075 [Phormidesmis sp.]
MALQIAQMPPCALIQQPVSIFNCGLYPHAFTYHTSSTADYQLLGQCSEPSEQFIEEFTSSLHLLQRPSAIIRRSQIGLTDFPSDFFRLTSPSLAANFGRRGAAYPSRLIYPVALPLVL